MADGREIGKQGGKVSRESQGMHDFVAFTSRMRESIPAVMWEKGEEVSLAKDQLAQMKTDLSGQLEGVFDRFGLNKEELGSAKIYAPRVVLSRSASEIFASVGIEKEQRIIVVDLSGMEVTEDPKAEISVDDVFGTGDGELLNISLDSMFPPEAEIPTISACCPERDEVLGAFINGHESHESNFIGVAVDNKILLVGPCNTFFEVEDLKMQDQGVLVVVIDKADGSNYFNAYLSSLEMLGGWEELLVKDDGSLIKLEEFESEDEARESLAEVRETESYKDKLRKIGIEVPTEEQLDKLRETVSDRVNDALERVGFSKRADNLDLAYLSVLSYYSGMLHQQCLEKLEKGVDLPTVLFLSEPGGEIRRGEIHARHATELDFVTENGQRKGKRVDCLKLDLNPVLGKEFVISLPFPKLVEGMGSIDGRKHIRQGRQVVVENAEMFSGIGDFVVDVGRVEKLEACLLIAEENVDRGNGRIEKKIRVASLYLPENWNELRAWGFAKKQKEASTAVNQAAAVNVFADREEWIKGTISAGNYQLYEGLKFAVDNFPNYDGLSVDRFKAKIGYYKDGGAKIDVDVLSESNGNLKFEFRNFDFSRLLAKSQEDKGFKIEDFKSLFHSNGADTLIIRISPAKALEFRVDANVFDAARAKRVGIFSEDHPNLKTFADAVHQFEAMLANPDAFSHIFSRLKPVDVGREAALNAIAKQKFQEKQRRQKEEERKKNLKKKRK